MAGLDIERGKQGAEEPTKFGVSSILTVYHKSNHIFDSALYVTADYYIELSGIIGRDIWKDNLVMSRLSIASQGSIPAVNPT